MRQRGFSLFLLEQQLAAFGDSNPGGKTTLIVTINILHCLLGHESSLLMQALHVMGMPVASIRRYLSTVVENTGTTKAVADLPIQRMSRLLQRVFKEAAELAGQEHCALISESHLIRAHLDRVAGATDNLYQRFRIDTSRLRPYLAQYKTDRLPSETQRQAEGIEDIEGYLLSRVINQEHAVRSVVPALRRMRIGLSEPGRPIGVFLFLGPTGVGKTELSHAIADVIFGPKPGVRDPYLITLNCGDYVNKWDIVRLIGATQGLVGYDEGGQLINGLRAKPKSVILFDEAEKAHPDVWQSLLPLFDEGIVREANGTEHDATGCVIVATSNLGYKEAMQQFNLWQVTPEQRGAVQRDVEEFIWKRVQEYFSPEFRGRFGRENIIFFNHFDLPSYQAIIRLQVQRLIDEMERHGLTIKVDKSVVNFLADLAWQGREEGARPVRRLITIHLRDQLVHARTDDPQRTLFSFTVLAGSGKVVLES